MSNRDREFMEKAVRLSREGMQQGRGGPFGCVIVKDGEIIGTGTNRVTSDNDPTAHAEMVAIRDACRQLQSFQLADCDIYSSCEPCPMCMAAIYWARPRRVFFANSRHDAAEAGFDDAFIYDELAGKKSFRKFDVTHLPSPGAKEVFEEWKRMENKTPY